MPRKKAPLGLVGVLVSLFLTAFWVATLHAAVAPNGQVGECGPYYLWYQTSPDSYPPLIDYLDLCGITFDISDVINDFDFVYFTDNEKFQRTALDQDQDGVSDLFFEGRTQNQLKWRPPGGCVRVNLRQCQNGAGFRKECGYAMISVQPKRGFQDGSARISIGVNAKCPPNWSDCSRSYEFVHRYANCFEPTPPEFVIQLQVSPEFADSNYKKEEMFQFTVTVRNTGTEKENYTELKNTMSSGSKGGMLHLSSFNIVCPKETDCELIKAGTDGFSISILNIPPDGVARITYTMKIFNDTIPKGIVSYFSNIATLSTGNSTKLTVGVSGVGEEPPNTEPERRQERPREQAASDF